MLVAVADVCEYQHKGKQSKSNREGNGNFRRLGEKYIGYKTCHQTGYGGAGSGWEHAPNTSSTCDKKKVFELFYFGSNPEDDKGNGR